MESLLGYIQRNVYMVVLVLLILNILLLLAVILLLIKQIALKSRMDLFMRGTNGEALEHSLREVMEDNKMAKVQAKNNADAIQVIKENLLTAYRKIGVVKYNAFPGMAGKVSSSIALLNNENDGFIVNSIHGKDGCYTYVKEIMNGKSMNPLTKEDEEALNIALGVQE